MKHPAALAIGAAVLAAAAAGGGYWIGNRNAVEAAPPAVAAKTPRILYYRNPMGLPDTSPVPKKDPMGMDYIPVHEGEDDAGGASQLRISTEKVQKLGVRTEKASIRTIDRAVRAAGRVEPDERRTFTIAPKFEGYVERLHVNATGQEVVKGQPLFEVYSPELVSAQREYAIAAQGLQSLKGADSDAQGGMKQLAESSLMRLKNWDISEEQVRALARSGEAKRTMTFRSPVSGVVTEKKAVQGMRFMPGEMLYQVTDLSTVWVLADVFEQDIGLLKPRAKAKVAINAYPGKEFEGTVTYIYPTLQSATRTVQVRLELPNPGHMLKPGMFADVQLGAASRGSAVTVPVSAVIDSGTRRIVLVQAGEGRFEPREVKLGASGNEYVEILDGVKEGEDVVVAANFLIDAESNLKAAVGGFTAPQAKDKQKGAGHQAEGTIDEIDASTGTVSISHGPIDSLKWPAMTMDFKVANRALLTNMKPGTPIRFEFVERQEGEWVITGFQPAPATIGKAPPQPGDPHAGHR
ncbi:efflux RND transporter periplasmic adaptor subunit [Noviherbaspirillum denitrificans]|uniref:Efflux transporter periplasmic adaptor subunit n=1 Tax=Noviherbaspirillum denitrificans TaxID=1968433 RepID=A0A254TF18_9BURK|nr:efflux RND transporter periplasmic adaptor subunit [Noviherbaspirillum denitrificans]OWW19922.1 efflux transporter periplasmic adaptor subunit [Noviherbaspirillum denitrificans]